MADDITTPTKQLILRAVLKDVSPIVARVISVPDKLEIHDLHDVFLAMLDWDSAHEFIIRIHSQEFCSYRRRSRGKRLRDFRLRRQEKFLYICDTLDCWEWEMRVLDVEPSDTDETHVVCLKGRGAAPPQYCGGPRGYHLMLRRQEDGAELSDPDAIASSIQLLSETYPDATTIDWQFLEQVVNEGWKNVEERLRRTGPLKPNRFSLKETNDRVELLMQRRRWWR